MHEKLFRFIINQLREDLEKLIPKISELQTRMLFWSLLEKYHELITSIKIEGEEDIE